VSFVGLATSLALLAFNGGDDTGGSETSWPGLGDREMLVRTSLDLRGIRPSVAEMEAVDTDPGQLESTLDGFFSDARFSARVRDLFSYAYLTRVESYYEEGLQYGYELAEAGEQVDLNMGDFLNSVGEEILRSVSTLAEEDLPWTDLVTAEWTMADEHIGTLWPLDYPEGATGWQKVRYTDGRPLAGILSANSLYWRFTSTISNRNRGRANAISRMLLCNDYLSREVAFSRDVDLLDSEATLNAVKTVDGCLACHASLDPLASHLWGFQVLRNTAVEELETYHAERERWWEIYTDIPPEYFGTPTRGLVDLGRYMAADPRLVSCAVEQVFAGLLHREVTPADSQSLINHETRFRNEGKALRALYRSVVASPEYRAAGDPEDDRFAHNKMMRPEQVVTAVEELTGYRFTRSSYDLFQAVSVGLRTLSGGADGVTVLSPADSPMTTMLLSHERLAEAAAMSVVQNDTADRSAPRLFDVVDPSVEASQSEATEQIEALFLRFLSRDPTDERTEELLSLLGAAYDAGGDAQQAWAAVVAALIRDPDFLFY
jgi:hypothetical protein